MIGWMACESVGSLEELQGHGGCAVLEVFVGDGDRLTSLLGPILSVLFPELGYIAPRWKAGADSYDGGVSSMALPKSPQSTSDVSASVLPKSQS